MPEAYIFDDCSIREFWLILLLGDEIWVAEHDLGSNVEDELSLKKGELIYVIEKSASGWWKGRCDDDRAGWLPASYLRPPESHEVQEKKKVSNYVMSMFRFCLQTEAMSVYLFVLCCL